MNEYTTAGFGAAINGKHTWKDYGLVIGNTDIVGERSGAGCILPRTGRNLRIFQKLKARHIYPDGGCGRI